MPHALRPVVPHDDLNPRLMNGFYVEAMVLADEARHYFDAGGRAERDALPPMVRVAFSCESLKVTTRLMHVIAWLLTQRGMIAGGAGGGTAGGPGGGRAGASCRLGVAPVSDAAVVAALPPQAQAMIAGSIDLYRRVARLDSAQALDAPLPSPARTMLDRLATSF